MCVYIYIYIYIYAITFYTIASYTTFLESFKKKVMINMKSKKYISKNLAHH